MLQNPMNVGGISKSYNTPNNPAIKISSTFDNYHILMIFKRSQFNIIRYLSIIIKNPNKIPTYQIFKYTN